MIKGKTKTGFEYEIHDNVLDDFEVLELVGAVDENTVALPKLLTALFGEEQKKAYTEHMRDSRTKKISTKAILEDINDLFESLGEEPETKNS